MLTTESLKRIDREIAKYPLEQKQSAVMAALAIAQEEQGWLSSDAIEFVANYLGMAPMAGQGGKGEDSKAKRAQQDEEALYAEDRPWTEAVIGNRRRKDGPDNKESK
jgi:NADH:ubiquinone oxidoreductase subunit E